MVVAARALSALSASTAGLSAGPAWPVATEALVAPTRTRPDLASPTQAVEVAVPIRRRTTTPEPVEAGVVVLVVEVPALPVPVPTGQRIWAAVPVVLAETSAVARAEAASS